MLILLFAEWFYNHPALRYGGYPLIALLLFLPIAQYLSKKNYLNFNINIRAYFLIFLTLSVFLLGTLIDYIMRKRNININL